jgi:hypothetical protein
MRVFLIADFDDAGTERNRMIRQSAVCFELFSQFENTK